MLLLPLLLPLAISTAVAAEILGTWTVFSLVRACTPTGTACTYTLTFDINYFNNNISLPNHYDNAANAKTCTVTILSPSPPVPANQTDFTSQPCGSNSSSSWDIMVNGGWDAAGFMTIVMTDVEKGAYAFFGYGDGEMGEGVVAGVRRRPALRVGTFEGGDDDYGLGAGEGGEGEGDGGEGKKGGGYYYGNGSGVEVGGGKKGVIPRPGEGREKRKRSEERERRTWQIKGFSKFPDLDLNVTDVHFSIEDSEFGTSYCALAVKGNARDSWYAEPCDDFTISWGYNRATDSAVMTVCHPATGTDAWFGFEKVSQDYIGDSRREPVYYTGCK